MTADRNTPVFTLTPGPAGATPATLAALSQPILHHQDPVFLALYAETVDLLRRAFGTAEDPVIFPGEAVVGLEAAAASLIAPGDVVLNLVGVAEADVRAIARSESGVMLSGGQAGLPVVQIAHMGPAAYPLSPVIALVALGRALRRVGAAADVGAAVEAAIDEDPDRERRLSGITGRKGPRNGIGRPVMTQQPNVYEK